MENEGNQMVGMPGRSGGSRPGPRRRRSKTEEIKDYAKAGAKNRISPLEYMLSVLSDPNADVGRRDRMAMAAAPYCHPKISERPVSLKFERQEAAKTAGQGTEWGDDLMSPVVRLDEHRAKVG